MKICFSFLSFAADIFAGIENSIYNLSLGFRSVGIETVVYSSHLSGSDLCVGPIPVFRSELLPKRLPQGNLNGDLALRECLLRNAQEIRREFHRFIVHERVDVVISCDPLWGITQVSGAWKDAPCPFILSLHVLNTIDLLEEARRIPYLFRRAVSGVLKRQVIEVDPEFEVEVIPNSIDTSRFKPSDTLNRDSKIILCNSRIDPGKGVQYLVQAFAKFRRKFSGYELWLCNGSFPFGDKSIAATEVQSEIDSLGVGRYVRFLPNLSWSRVPDVVRQSFVVVLPTLYESFGRAAAEALACGVPLIASRAGNIPELVRDAAILVEPRSPGQIYESLVRLHQNPEEYQFFSHRGPEVAADYDNAVVAARFLGVIKERLNN